MSVAVFGGLAIAMAYLVSELGDLLTAALSLSGMMNGPLVGLFTLGLMFPFTNSLVRNSLKIHLSAKLLSGSI